MAPVVPVLTAVWHPRHGDHDCLHGDDVSQWSPRSRHGDARTLPREPSALSLLYPVSGEISSNTSNTVPLQETISLLVKPSCYYGLSRY